MSNGEIKGSKKSILTWRFTLTLITVAVIIALFTPPITHITPPWFYFSVAISANTPLAIMFVALIIGNIFPERISNKHIALIAATSTMAMLIPGGRPTIPDVFDIIISARQSPFSEFYVFTFGPDIKYIEDLLAGRGDVPWSAWLPTLLWWVMYSMSWLLLILALLSIVRHRWMDIEILPYPIGYVWSVPIIAASPERRVKGLPIDRRLVVFLTGALVGFLYTWLLIMRFIIPWLPDIFGWTTPNFSPSYPGLLKIEALPNLMKIVGLDGIPTNLIEYITFMLVPLDVLLSAWVTSITLLLIAQILYLKGYYSGLEKLGYGSRSATLGQIGPLKIRAVHFGIILGIGLLWLIFNAKYIGRTLKSAIKGPTKEEVEREAITYRTAWSTILICLISLFILYNVSNVTLFGASLIILQYFLLGLSISRIYGLSPIGSIDFHYLCTLPQLAFYEAELPTPEYMNTMVLGQRVCTGEFVFNASYAAMWFKVAKDVDIRPKDMFIALLIGALVGGILQWFIELKFLYSIGYDILPRGNLEGHMATKFVPTNVKRIPSLRPWWPHLISGLTITGILSYLRVRFVGWPIDPVGVALGLGYTFNIPAGMFRNVVQPFVPFIAWVIKYLIIKTGGARAHDNVLVPFATGVLSGTSICWFVGGIALIVSRIRILPGI